MKNFIDCVQKRVSLTMHTYISSSNRAKVSATSNEEKKFESEDEVIDYTVSTEAVLSMGLNEAELEYSEKNLSDEVAKYKIHINEEEMSIYRDSEGVSNLIILNPSKPQETVFYSPYGGMNMKIITEELDISLKAREGKIYASYLIAFSDENEYRRNELEIEYHELKRVCDK